MRRKAVILAAGMGTRLKPLTSNNHKCLTLVCGVSILKNALNMLAMNEFLEVVLVVGYLKDKVKETIGLQYKGMQIIYADNNRYAETNTSFSLQIGLGKTSRYDELYVLEGDVFFEDTVLKRLISAYDANATILEKYNSDLDGTFVTLDKDCNVIDWTHKNARPKEYDVTDKFKTVNIHKFSFKFVESVLKAQVDNTVSTSFGRESLETVMRNIVVKNPKAVKGIVLNGEKWFEIDDISDLDKAERLFGGK